MAGTPISEPFPMIGPGPSFRIVLQALDLIGIPYMVGGSLASSLYGIPRSTNDIDLVADVRANQVDELVQELHKEFYTDPTEAIRQALRIHRMFNLIHFASGYKFDIYPLRPEPYHLAAFARRKMKESNFDE